MPRTLPTAGILHFLWGGQSCTGSPPEALFRAAFRIVDECSWPEGAAQSLALLPVLPDDILTASLCLFYASTLRMLGMESILEEVGDTISFRLIGIRNVEAGGRDCELHL